MESVNLEMEDIFDNGGDLDGEDNFNTAPLIPDLEAEEVPMREGAIDLDASQTDDTEILSRLKKLKGAAKKRVQRPQAKLDPDRLQSDRGIPILPKLFENVKFKGVGHETEDLTLLMSKLEHWAHRLFPKAQFDEFIDRLERLGHKKPVQTCVNRIRLDMPVLGEDYVTQYDGDDNVAVTGSGDNEPTENNTEDDFDAEEAFEEMIRQEQEQMRKQKEQEAAIEEEDDASTAMDTSAMNVSMPSQVSQETPSTPATQPPSQLSQSTSGSTLTPDQLERIQRNKMKALEKKAARLGIPVSVLLSDTMTNSQAFSSSAEHSESSQLSTTDQTEVNIKNSTPRQGGNIDNSTPREGGNTDLQRSTQTSDTDRVSCGDHEVVDKNDDDVSSSQPVDSSAMEDSQNRTQTTTGDQDMQTEDEIMASLGDDEPSAKTDSVDENHTETSQPVDTNCEEMQTDEDNLAALENEKPENTA